jgi:hypothetical protein
MGILNSEGSSFFDRKKVLGTRNGKIAPRGELRVGIHWKRHWIQTISIRFDKRPGEFVDHRFRNSDQEKENLLLPRYSIGST